jgi:hypothetical protein
VESPYGAFSTYVNEMPYNKPFDEDGNPVPTFLPSYLGYERKPNPLCDALLNSKNESKYTEIINNFSLEWSILKELTARV